MKNKMSKFFVDRAKLSELLSKYQSELQTVVPLVVICGPGKCSDEKSCDVCEPAEKLKCMYNLRKVLKQALIDNNCLATIFEEDFDLQVASLEEQIILKSDDVDIVFIIPLSEGSAAELGIFAKDTVIKPKLRVLVPFEYHPLYTEKESFLTSLYRWLMSDLGHIYPFDVTGELHPTPTHIVLKMMESYRLNKVLRAREEGSESHS